MLSSVLLLAAEGLALLGAGIGAGIVALGAGLGIGKIGGSAMESIARQPEAGGKVQTAMIISAALIEGVALFGVIVCLIIAIS
jgi:F-type H+-transporting ATPase subunit c